MGYKLKRLFVENFKYIEPRKAKGIDFGNYNITILDGPNGYGKSTFFDAIELLITGNIKHFNDDLLNRGKESLVILANNKDFDVVIKAVFSNDNNEIAVKRVFKCEDDFNSNIFVLEGENENEISQDQFYDSLGINKSLFDIGVYISQSESLEFLQQKYKDRKEQLTSILDSSEITIKIDNMKKFRDLFNIKCDTRIKTMQKEKDELVQKTEALSKLINEIENETVTAPYKKMFEKDYVFDCENIDVSLDYETVIQPLNDIESLIIDFDIFIKTKANNKIDTVIGIDKNEYIALYFKQKIDDIGKNNELIKNLIKTEDYLKKIEVGDYSFDEMLLSFLEIDKDLIGKIKAKLNEKHNIQKQMTSNQNNLNDFLDKRSKLLISYKSAVEIEVVEDTHCPFCGFETNEVEKLYDITSELLKQNKHYTDNAITGVNAVLDDIFKNHVIVRINQLLNSHKTLVNSYKKLNFYTSLNPLRLDTHLKEFGIDNFINTIDEVELEIFEKDYKSLIDILEKKKVTLDKAINIQQIEKYTLTLMTYYNNLSPYHSLDDIKSKKIYVTSSFSNKYKVELSTLNQLLSKLNSEFDEYVKNTSGIKSNIVDLVAKYEESYRQYQTDIANSIKIPLFILSGKIIQNYPMGLGIGIEVKDNQVVFRAQGKECDVFNILSTGQLNGVILSILLSIKSVFVREDALDILLIDDPLQSIDDISAYSFADVLSEDFNNTQVIISTHEDDKSNLLKFKYDQAGLDSQSFNMQKFYLDN